MLSRSTGWTRHNSWVTANVTNSHTSIVDTSTFKQRHLPNQYLNLIAGVNGEKINADILSCQPDELQNFLSGAWVIHTRNSVVRNVEQDFRNSEADNVLALVRCARDQGVRVVNISENRIPVDGIINLFDVYKTLPRAETIIRAIAGGKVFVGDSSGPTMVAQVLNKPCLLFNLFPYNVIPKNSKSLVLFRKIYHGQTLVKFNDPKFEKINSCTYSSELDDLGISLAEADANQLQELVHEYLTLYSDGPAAIHKKLLIQYRQTFKYFEDFGFISKLNSDLFGGTS